MKKALELAYPIVLARWIETSTFLKIYPRYKPKYQKILKEELEKRNEKSD
jgi:hypothetical protein